MVVADPGEPVLAPVIGARAGLIVAEIVPGVPVAAVVFADGAPLPLGEIRPPEFPEGVSDIRRTKAGLFGGILLFGNDSFRMRRN